MARVTIEDSLKKCPNVYHLIRLASKRAHQLQHGAQPKIVNARGEKGIPDAATVLALREIAAGFTDFDNEELPETDAYGRKIFRKPEIQTEEQDNGTDIL
jgi:DNA-directed RNA polymerase subunit omega